MGFSVTHSDGSVTRHDSYESAMSAANASAAKSGASVQDTTSRASSGGGNGGGGFGGDKSSSGKDWSPGPSTSTSKTGTSVSGQTGGGSDSWGWDRNKDGNISLAEKFLDRFDGGGRGRTGPTFEGGLFSDALNSMGVSPYGQGSGRFSNFLDPILGTSLPGTQGLAPMQPTQLSQDMRGDGQSASTDLGLPPPTPTEPPPEEEAETSVDGGSMLSMYPQFFPQALNLAPGAAGPGTVGAPDLIYEDYLARLMQANNLLNPLPLAPIPGPSASQQGIGSLMPGVVS